MNRPTWLTLARLLLVPVFATLANYYGQSVRLGHPQEHYRWWAIAVFLTASLTDALDGYLARRTHQRTPLGAILDPLADKALTLTALITLALIPWGPGGWRLPIWFVALVITREALILGGIVILAHLNGRVPIHPHWSSKVCTVLLLSVLAWVMLKIIPISPYYPAALASIFLIYSSIAYLRQGITLLPSQQHPPP